MCDVYMNALSREVMCEPPKPRKRAFIMHVCGPEQLPMWHIRLLQLVAQRQG